jgi:hypothetical protein
LSFDQDTDRIHIEEGAQHLVDRRSEVLRNDIDEIVFNDDWEPGLLDADLRITQLSANMSSDSPPTMDLPLNKKSSPAKQTATIYELTPQDESRFDDSVNTNNLQEDFDNITERSIDMGSKIDKQLGHSARFAAEPLANTFSHHLDDISDNS